MPSRRHVPVLLALAASAVAPSGALAQSGVGGAEAAPEPEIASARVGAVFVATKAGALNRSTVRFRGAIPAGDAGRTITVERLDPLTIQWTPIAHAVAAGDGRYVARWKADRAGRQDVRVRVEGPSIASAAAAPQIGVTIYTRSLATWYGPGFYGRRTACGTTMTPGLQGVAHKSLPCGTLVTVFYGGRAATVPVVDRGPFRPGVRYDLTAATARSLGFATKATVGVQRFTPPPPPA